MIKYVWTDSNQNTFTMRVDGERVTLANQHQILCALSNVAFMMGANGYAEETRLVREAARNGLMALRAVTRLDWKELRS